MSIAPPLVIQPVKAAFPKTTLSVPHVSGGESPEAARLINRSIAEHARKLRAGQGSLEDPNAEMLGWFEVKTNEKGVLSLSLYNYAYTGGAHGMTLQQSLTFNAATGAQYGLSDLFKPGSDYVGRISAIVAQGIQDRGIDTLEPFVRIAPDQSFYVADRSLVVYFQLYELAAYVYGFLYFPIPVYELQDIINEHGPLGPMLQND